MADFLLRRLIFGFNACDQSQLRQAGIERPC
jgi:hypothetical protein